MSKNLPRILISVTLIILYTLYRLYKIFILRQGTR